MPTTAAAAAFALRYARVQALELARDWGIDSPEQVLVFGLHSGGAADGSGDQTMTVATHAECNALAVISIEGGPFEWVYDAADAIDAHGKYFPEPINGFQLGLYRR